MKNNLEDLIMTMDVPIVEDNNEKKLLVRTFEAFCEKHNCKPADIRLFVENRIKAEQDKIASKNAKDIAAGKYKDLKDMFKRMPLARLPHPDGGYILVNVPPYMMTWYAFMAWINESSEDHGPGHYEFL